MEEQQQQKEEQTPHTTTTQDPISAVHIDSPPQISSTQSPNANCDHSDTDSDSDFEFPSVTRNSSDIAADEIFADGQIRPLYYPVFGRPIASQPKSTSPSRLPLGELFLQDQDRSSSTGSTSSSSSSTMAVSDTSELDGVPPESYCLWSPASSASSSPARKKQPNKSGSTGSMARWRRISEMVVGRSRSDGQQKFVFLSPPAPTKDQKDGHHHQEIKKEKGTTTTDKKSSNNNKANELDHVSANRILYGHTSYDTKRRTTSLPYRPELVGLFANVNGLSRTHHHPF